MPFIEAGQYLLDAMTTLGPVTITGFGGELPVTWSELYAFGKATKMVEEPWEYDLLMELCISYLDGKNAGKDPLSRQPIDIEDEE